MVDLSIYTSKVIVIAQFPEPFPLLQGGGIFYFFHCIHLRSNQNLIQSNSGWKLDWIRSCNNKKNDDPLKSNSPPARWGLLDFIRAVVLLLLRLLLQFLLDHVCINFHLHFRLANSSPSSSPTSELSAHRWTSTWDLPSSVRTAGPQPGTFPAQCAPLDLNGQIECQKICQVECQIECQKICQIEFHKICQIECQKICQIEC